VIRGRARERDEETPVRGFNRSEAQVDSDRREEVPKG